MSSAETGPVRSGRVPAPPPGFRPRPDLVAVLSRPGPRVRVLTGPPGAGRTHLAAAVARARRAEGWLVAWVDASDVRGVLGGLAEVCGALGLARCGDEQQAGPAVRRRLEAGGDRCLLVFDDVADAGLVRPFLPRGGRARVVVVGDGAAGLGEVVPVGAFTGAEAAAFLAERAGLAEDAGARDLAAGLGNLPLALELAAGVIRTRGVGYRALLERLRAREGRGPAEGAALLALEAVREDDPTGVCGPLLELLSVLSPNGAPAALVRAAGGAGLPGGVRAAPEVVDRALARLARASLVTTTAGVCAHRLVLDVVRRERAGDAACAAATALLDARAVELWPDRHRDRRAVRDLVGQIAALHDAAARGRGDDAAAGGITRLRWWATTLLNELGDSPAQAVLTARSLAADEGRALGADHPKTLAARDNLAVTYRIAGRTTEAIALHERTAADCERVLGADHPATSAARNNLALAYRAAGRTTEAIALHHQTLTTRERVLGPDHPRTLASRNNLALAYRAAGRTTEAIALHHRTLTTRERVLGPRHPDTLASRNNLALAYQAAGRTAEAIALHHQTLTTREEVLGPDHPGTAATRENLARAYRAAGRADEATALREQGAAHRRRPAGGLPRPRPALDDLVLCLAATGLAHREIAARAARAWGAGVTEQAVAEVVGRVVDGMAAWRARPLEPVYAAIFVDELPGVRTPGGRDFRLAVGVTAEGGRDFLALWADEPDRDALAGIRDRGARDACLVVCDGVEGVPAAVRGLWPGAVVQPSTAHLVRTAFPRPAGPMAKRDRAELLRDLKPLYAAGSEQAAAERFAGVAAKWADRHPAALRHWRAAAWPGLVSFLRWDHRVRAVLVRNAAGSLDPRFVRSLRGRGRFPDPRAALERLHLVVTALERDVRAQERWRARWRPALDALDAAFGDRLRAGRTA